MRKIIICHCDQLEVPGMRAERSEVIYLKEIPACRQAGLHSLCSFAMTLLLIIPARADSHVYNVKQDGMGDFKTRKVGTEPIFLHTKSSFFRKWALSLFFLFFMTLLGLTMAHANINNGLIGYWDFEEGEGTTASGGTLVNGPVWTEGIVGKTAISLDGSNDYVETNYSEPITGALSIAAWFYSPSGASIITKGNSSNAGHWYLDFAWGNRVMFIKNGSTNLIARSAAVLSPNKWQHIVMTWTGEPSASSIQFYLNGKPVARDLVVNGVDLKTDPGHKMRLGGYLNANTLQHQFKGLLDEVRVYNRVLTPQEAFEAYNFPAIPDTTPPSVPANVKLSNLQPKEVAISWDASIDQGKGNVVGYLLYRDGVEIATLNTLSFVDKTVKPSTNYVYTVSAFDDALPKGNISAPSLALNVRTADADLTSPSITQIKVDVFSTLAKISWVTDEPADSQVEYGPTTGYGDKSVIDAQLTIEHSQMITGLMPSTSYHFKIRSSDIEKNLGTSQDQVLTTPEFIGPTANNIVEAGEACDGSDLKGLTCASVAAGFTGGTLKCKADRSGYDISGCVQGKTVTAASCNQVDVQSAIDAAQDGDSVLVPAGTCTWGTPVNIGKYSPTTKITTGKSIILKGAGVDQTIIIDDILAMTGAKAPTLGLTLQAGKPVRVTGFTFEGGKVVDNYASVYISGPFGQPLFRVDHCKFTNVTERGIIANVAYGLIDHNTFLRIPSGYTPTLISVIGDTKSWERPQDQGTANNVYMEDNTFIQNIQANGPFDMYDGARYVFRQNQLFGNGLGHHGFDSGTSGIMNFEIYNNKMVNGIPSTHPYFKMYAIVAKSDFTKADPVNGPIYLATLLSNGVLEEASATYVRLKTVGIARPKELPAHAFSRIWGILNGSFVHGIVFEFRSGSGVVFNNVVTRTANATGDTGGYDGFASLRNYRSGDGFITNYGYTFPWDGLHPGNGVCDGSNNLDGNAPIPTTGTGTHTGATGDFVLQDNTKSWTPGQLVNYWVWNMTKGVKAKIMANTANELNLDLWYRSEDNANPTKTLGVNNPWTNGDQYKITNGYPCRDQMGRAMNQSLSPVYAWNNEYQGKIGGNLRVAGYAPPPPGGIERISLHIVAGRDYNNDIPKPGYAPYVYPHPLVQMDAPELQGGSGDVSGDGKVTMYDAALVLRYTLGSSLSDTQKNAADINGDSKIDGADVVATARKALGL